VAEPTRLPAIQVLERAEMIIRLNGDRFELPGPITVRDLLGRINVDPDRVAVEQNLVVLKRGAFDTTLIAEGDEIEVVNFVGGGSLPRRTRPPSRPTPRFELRRGRAGALRAKAEGYGGLP
jgi:sulfur carrier protein